MQALYRALLTRAWIELRTERERLLQMLDEDANFGGHPAAGRSYGKDWHGSLKGCQKPEDGTFSEFCGEEPCRGLGNPQMFQDTHPQLFNIAGTKDSAGNDSLCVLPIAKAPRLYGASLDENDRSETSEIVRRFRCAVSCEVLRRGDENGHRLCESSRNQCRVWKVP